MAGAVCDGVADEVLVTIFEELVSKDFVELMLRVEDFEEDG